MTCPHTQYTVVGTEAERNLATGEVKHREWRQCVTCGAVSVVRVEKLK